MKLASRRILIIASLYASCSVVWAAAYDPNRMYSQLFDAKPGNVVKHGMSHYVWLKIEMAETTTIGHGAQAEITLTNYSAVPINYPRGFEEEFPAFSIEIRSQQNEDRVRFSGESAYKFRIGQAINSYNDFVTLDPGESRQWRINFSEFYDLPPGDYSLNIVQRFESDVRGHHSAVETNFMVMGRRMSQTLEIKELNFKIEE